MSLVFIESFDVDNGNLAAKGWIPGANYPYPMVSGRTGKAVNFPNGALGNSLKYPLHSAAHKTVSIGAAIWLTGGGNNLPLFTFDGVNVVFLTGVDLVCPLGSCGFLSVDDWHYVEATMTLGIGASGFCEVRVDGAVTFSGSGTTGTASTTTSVSLCNFFDLFGQSPIYMDDVYITNGAGSVNTGLLGDVRIVVLSPDGNGDFSQLENSSGNFTNNYTYVDSPVYQTSTFVASSTVGQEDTYAMQSMPYAGTIPGVQTVILADKDNAGFRNVEPVLRTSGTDYVGASTPLTMTPTYSTTVWEEDPATSSAWTEVAINGYQLGARVE